MASCLREQGKGISEKLLGPEKECLKAWKDYGIQTS
jgi:hypothetical protein